MGMDRIDISDRASEPFVELSIVYAKHLWMGEMKG